MAMTVSELVRMHDDGAITPYELASQLVEVTTEENVTEVVNALPAFAYLLVKDFLNRMPANDDEEGWSKMRIWTWGSISLSTEVKTRTRVACGVLRRYLGGDIARREAIKDVLRWFHIHERQLENAPSKSISILEKHV